MFALAAGCRKVEGGPGRWGGCVGRTLKFPKQESMLLALGSCGIAGEERRVGRLTEQQSNEGTQWACRFCKQLYWLCISCSRLVFFSLLQCIFAPHLHPVHPHQEHVILVVSCHSLHSISPKGLGMSYNRCPLTSQHIFSRPNPEALS